MKLHGDARDQARMTLWIWLATLGGAFALAPLTESRSYVVVGVVSAGLVCLAGLGLRLLRTPWPVIVLVQLIVLFWWAALTYAGESLTLGFVPDPSTVRAFDQLLSDAMQHSEQFAAPVPQNAALHAVLSISVGLLAIAIDLLAGSLSHAPAVGLVFLAVYMAPVALLSGHVSLWFFLPGALGFVFLLAAQERTSITRWGRNISYADSATLSQSRGIYSSGLASAGRRVGFGAVALAVVVPVLVPTFSTNLFGSGGVDGAMSGDGPGTIHVDDSIVVDMRRNLTERSDAELLKVTATDGVPKYVRLASLDSLSDNGWSPSQRGPKTTDLDGSLPIPPGNPPITVDHTSASFKVQVSDDFDTHWLPTIYAPQTIHADGDWRIDADNLDVVAAGDDTSAAGMSYTMDISYLRPTPYQYRHTSGRVPRSLDDMTSVPGDAPPVIEERAHEVTADARGAFEKALALQDWFRQSGGFEYSLEHGDGNGMETIQHFLTDDRTGYCEQFASAMAMMARELHIPARVAVGFLSGDQLGNTYVFRGTDMHAWPELYIGGLGWIAFDPTPSDRTGTGIDFTAPGGDNEPTIDPRDGGASPSNRATEPHDQQSDSAASPADSDDDHNGGGGVPWRGILTALLVLAVLTALGTLPRWLRVVRRRRRWDRATSPEDVAEAAWAELRDTVRDLRLPWPEGSTPRAAGRRLRPMIESREHAVDGLNRLVLAVERARYAEHAAPVDLRDDVETIGSALASRVSRRTRRRATWLPLSLLGGVRLPTRGHDQRNRPTQHELLALEE